MSDKVVGINGSIYDTSKACPPNEDVVEFLEEILEAAKKGEVQEVNIAYHYGDGLYQYSVGYCNSPYAMLGIIWDLGMSYRDDYCVDHDEE